MQLCVSFSCVVQCIVDMTVFCGFICMLASVISVDVQREGHGIPQHRRSHSHHLKFW